MANSRKTAPVRRPVKARGTLPQPRVAPQRLRVPLHRRRGVQVVAGILLLALIGVAVWQVVEWRGRVAEREEVRQAVRRFDRRLTVLQAPVRDTLGSVSTAPDAFLKGEMPPDQFRAEADRWLAAFRTFAEELRKREVPEQLEDTKAHLVTGATIYIDAIKIFRLAADSQEQATREQAVAQGRNVLYHADFVWSDGQRALEDVKREVGLETSPNPLREHGHELPEEEAPARGPAPG